MRGIMLDENGDFLLDGGRTALGEADGQTIENILRANRGELKESPLVGGEAAKLIGGQPDGMWCEAVKKQIQSVGVPASRVEWNDSELIVKI